MKNKTSKCISVLAFAFLFINIISADNNQNGAPIIQPGAPGENSKILDPDIAANIAGASYVEADLEFLKGMIIHHQQAIFMSKLANKRTNNKTIVDLANRIDVTQEDEINFMDSWLQDREKIMSASSQKKKNIKGY